MENWQRNLDAIARGKGSPQARDEECLICEICKDDEIKPDRDEQIIKKKLTKRVGMNPKNITAD